MQQTDGFGAVVDLHAARVAAREFNEDDLRALEICSLFLRRDDDPKDYRLIETDEGDQVAVFVNEEGDGVASVAKSRGFYIGLDGQGKVVKHSKEIRPVLVKLFTGMEMAGVGFLNARLKHGG